MTLATDQTPERGDRQPSWEALLGEVLRARHDPRQAGKTAALRFAAVPATEVSAFGYTEAYLGNLPAAKRAAARRAVGICAKHPGAPQPTGYLPLGGSLRLLHKREFGFDAGSFGTDGLRRNAMTMQVDALPLLDLETAVQTFDLLVGRCASHGLGVDFYDLTRTLLRWGNGLNTESRETRARLVRDFYSHTSP